MDKINPAQLAVLKTVLVKLGKEKNEVDGFIESRMNYGDIQVNAKGEVTKLNLYDNNLSGSIPPEIGQLSALTYLNLRSNNLSGSIPPEIGQLSVLTYLYLFDNNLSGSIPPEVGQLSALTYLGLWGNNLSGSVPPEIKNLKKLTTADFSNNSHLKCDASLFPRNCDVYTSATFTLRTKPVKTPLQKLMIVQYVVLGYADLITDILAIIELFASNNVLMAIINIFFIVLGMLLGLYNSPRKPMDIFLNLTQLSILVDGIETLRTGHQTEGLVVGKKTDAITRSMPSAIIQLYTLLSDSKNYPAGSPAYNVLASSVAIAIFGASITLSGLHNKAGNKLMSYQFCVLNLYYVSEILLRVLVISIAFICVQWYALIAVGIDILIRGLLLRADGIFDVSLVCVWLGSDNALEKDELWVRGSLLTFIESLIFIIVMLTLETDTLHTMREQGTAAHVSAIMLCAFVVKCFLFDYIEGFWIFEDKGMEKASDEEESEDEPVTSEMHKV